MCVEVAHHEKKKKMLVMVLVLMKLPKQFLVELWSQTATNEFWSCCVFFTCGANQEIILYFLNVTLQAANTYMDILINIFRTKNHCFFVWKHDNNLFLCSTSLAKNPVETLNIPKILQFLLFFELKNEIPCFCQNDTV